MAKIVLYIACSMDGYIARTNGSVDWLHAFEKNPDGTPQDHGYNAFLSSVGIVLMGSKTFETIQGFDMPYPYANKRSYIFSKRDLVPPPEGAIVKQDAAAFTKDLKADSKEDIWLIGGGQLNASLIDAGLVDEIRLFIVPVTLGEGIPLVANGSHFSSWRLLSAHPYPTGIVELQYAAR